MPLAGFNVSMMSCRIFLIVVLWMLGTGLVLAAPSHETLYIKTASDVEIPVERYGNADAPRLLWLPSEYGYATDRYPVLMGAISAAGFEVWQVRLHEAYFIPAGRKSLTQVPVEDVAGLIEQAVPDDGRKLFILSSGRGAALTFMALREWLGKNGRHGALGGVLLMHPNFMASTPEPGKQPKYLSVIHDVSLPLYILQPMGSAKRWYLPELTEQLSAAGSHVYAQGLPGVRDGFQGHPEATESEIRYANTQLPLILKRAAGRLAGDGFHAALADGGEADSEIGWSIKAIQTVLQDYPGTSPAPVLRLDSVKGQPISLDDYRGRVVLINFWATWCPPCVEEIPSLGRLQQKFPTEEFSIVSVDVGDQKKQVEQFLKKVPAEYPVMLDSEGRTVHDWNLRAFPTTFVIDRQGIIRLAYFGGLQWDAPEVVKQLRELVEK
jgi:thiol-disulfide isomerase/thioredoxin